MRFSLKSGHTLRYLSSGRGETTLVMLHPIGLRAGLWKQVAQELGDQYRIIAVDAPGHGKSDVFASAPSIDEMAGAVQELLEAVGGSRIVPIGCSMGSSMAAALAVRMKDKVAALVLANSSYAPAAPNRGVAQAQRAEAARLGMANVLPATLERWFSADVLANRPEMVDRVTRWLLAGDPVVHAWCWKALGEFDYGPLLPSLTMPALAVGGEFDRAAVPAATRVLAEALPAGRYVEIAGAGHLSPLEQPGPFAAAVREFLNTSLRSK